MIVCTLICAATAGCKNNVSSKSQAEKSNCETTLPPLDSAPEYARRGANFLNEGRDSCALDDCQKAVELDEKNVEALTCRGYSRDRGKDFDGAESDFDEAIKLAPSNSLILYRRAALYRETKRFDKALTDLNKAIEMMPVADNYAFRAEVYAETDDFENAAEDYAEAIRRNPNNRNYYQSRAEIYRLSGKNDLAAADEKKYTELGAAEKPQERDEPDKDAVAILNDVAVNFPKPVIRLPPAPSKQAAKSKFWYR